MVWAATSLSRIAIIALPVGGAKDVSGGQKREDQDHEPKIVKALLAVEGQGSDGRRGKVYPQIPASQGFPADQNLVYDESEAHGGDG
jgi:hypothetical protein